MKKISLSLVSILMAISLSACGGKTASDSAANEISLEPLTEVKLPTATEVVPENNDPNSVGLMAFYPNNNENMYALAGTNTFTVYFESKHVKLGSGKIGIYEATSNAIYATRDAKDIQSIEVGEMDEIGTALTGWTEGTKIDIYFDKIFTPGSQYYVLIDGGFFTLGTVQSGAVTNASLITFDAKNYGVDTSTMSLGKTYNEGDIVTLNVLCDGFDATMFAFKEYDTNFIEVSPLNGTSDTTATIKFIKAGKPSITVSYYNSGHEVDSISFTFNVAGEGGEIDEGKEAEPLDDPTDSSTQGASD